MSAILVPGELRLRLDIAAKVALHYSNTFKNWMRLGRCIREHDPKAAVEELNRLADTLTLWASARAEQTEAARTSAERRGSVPL